MWAEAERTLAPLRAVLEDATAGINRPRFATHPAMGPALARLRRFLGLDPAEAEAGTEAETEAEAEAEAAEEG